VGFGVLKAVEQVRRTDARVKREWHKAGLGSGVWGGGAVGFGVLKAVEQATCTDARGKREWPGTAGL
jgi:hypothetical protein